MLLYASSSTHPECSDLTGVIMITLILAGIVALLMVALAALQYKKKFYGGAILVSILALAMIASMVWTYSGRNSSREISAVVSETPTTSGDGSVIVNVLTLPGGGRYRDIHCSDSIGDQRCASMTVGTVVTILNTTDEYGVDSTSTIVDINDTIH